MLLRGPMIVLFGFVHLLPALVFGSSPLVEKPTGPLIKELYDSCLAAHASDSARFFVKLLGAYQIYLSRESSELTTDDELEDLLAHHEKVEEHVDDDNVSPREMRMTQKIANQAEDVGKAANGDSSGRRWEFIAQYNDGHVLQHVDFHWVGMFGRFSEGIKGESCQLCRMNKSCDNVCGCCVQLQQQELQYHKNFVILSFLEDHRGAFHLRTISSCILYTILPHRTRK